MSVSAVTSNMASVYGTEYSTSAKKAETEKKEETAGAVYETSEKKEEKATYSINKMSAADRASLVSQLKADAEARQSQFVSMVQKMMSEQTNAYGQANDIWKFLASGEYTVDPATKAQAQADIAEDGYYYADYVTCDSDTLTVSRSDGWTKQYSKTTHRYLIELGECKAGTEIHITNMNAENISFRVYQMNFNALDEAYATMGRQTMELTDMTDRRIEGEIQVSEAGRLILPVPADQGWELYVDGRKTQINPFFDALIAVHLEEGNHTIRLQYTTPGLKIGAAVSAGALGLFALSMLCGIWKKKGVRDGKKTD